MSPATSALRNLLALCLVSIVLIACGGGGSSSGGSGSNDSGGLNIRNFQVEASGPLMADVRADVSDSDGALDDVRIQWGDGNVSQLGADSEVNATHVYAQAGTYTVTIIAFDDKGRSTSRSQSVDVAGE